MATEIVRPSSAVAPLGGTLDDPEAYNRINETIADDDSTTISMPKLFAPLFGFTIDDPNRFLNNTISLKFFVRARTSYSSNVFKVGVYTFLINESGAASEVERFVSNQIVFANTKVWEDFLITIDDLDAISSIVSGFNDGLESGYESVLYASLWSENTGSKATTYPTLTQLYLEIEYEDGSTTITPAMYLKQEDAWSPIYGTVYQKTNGVWSESTLDSLSADDKIIVKELN